MSVVGGGITLVFCEGDENSFDKRLLSRLLLGKPPTVAIEPAGGKYQLRAFVRGRLAAERGGAKYLAFRDRDFDAEPSREVSLIQFRGGQPIYMSHRAAVENYLIDAALIHRYWDEHGNTAPTWRHGASPGESNIRSWMDEAARILASYQAVRWALAILKPSDRWPEVSTTWTEGSGYLPSSLDESECLEQAKKLVSGFAAATAGVSEGRFLQNYERFAKQFMAHEFIDEAHYLVWFHGKDLRKAMQKLRPNSISLEHFCGWSVENLDWAQHADLRELATKI